MPAASHGTSAPDVSLAEPADSAELGRELRCLLRRARTCTGRKLTCRELAEVTGYSHGSISNWLQGRSLPAADRLADLLIALGASGAEQRRFATARDRIEDRRRDAASASSSRSAPAGFVPAGSVPAGSVPAGPLPAGSVPAGSVPAAPPPAGSAPVGIGSGSGDRQARCTPRELPAGVHAFTGRAAELRSMDQLLATVGQGATVGQAEPGGQGEPGGHDASAVVICAVSGMPGVGKTALAVRWAHRVAARFPDGQLYVNLRGYDPAQPMAAGDALASFLSALGVPGHEMPITAEERASRFRTRTHGKRLLILLDNAATAEQVRPLLPGCGPAVVVVTSRDSLAGLVAREGARRVSLGLLPRAEATALLRTLLGDRVDAEPAATAALVRACGRLPLALRVAAERAAAYPGASLGDLVAELRDQRERLSLLDAGGDQRGGVSDVFSWSYWHLPAQAAAAFRLLSLHPGPDWDRYAAAALAGVSPRRAGRLLDILARAHLIEPAGLGRYAMHDLLRDYASGVAESTDSERSRQDAADALLGYYQSATSAATEALSPCGLHPRPQLPPGAPAVPPASTQRDALSWLDSERAALVRITCHAAACGRSVQAVGLAATLRQYLLGGGHYADAAVVFTCAERAASAIGDRSAQAHLLTSLGAVYRRQGHYELAAGRHEQARCLASEIGDRLGEARALGNLGNVYLRQCRYELAASRLSAALALFEQLDDQAGQAIALDNLGVVCLGQGRYADAADHHTGALDLYRQIRDREGEANALNNIGQVRRRQGRPEEAAEHHALALRRYRDAGDKEGEAQTLTDIGAVCQHRGGYQQALGYHQQALDLYRQVGDRDGEAVALNGAGESLLASGQPALAWSSHDAALVLASQTGDRQEQARAHAGLGAIGREQGRYAKAVGHYQDALAVYRSIGDRGGEAVTLNDLGQVLFAAGEPECARACHAAVLAITELTGDLREHGSARRHLARACRTEGHPGGTRKHAAPGAPGTAALAGRAQLPAAPAAGSAGGLT